MTRSHFYIAAAITIALPLSASANEAELTAAKERGAVAYALCAACHGPDGQGIAIGEQKMASSLTGGLAMADPSILALLTINGITKDANSPYLGVMAPLGGTMDDQKLADVITYVRNSFGNEEGTVYTEEQAAEFRAKWAEIKGPVSREKLKELAEKE